VVETSAYTRQGNQFKCEDCVNPGRLSQKPLTPTSPGVPRNSFVPARVASQSTPNQTRADSPIRSSSLTPAVEKMEEPAYPSLPSHNSFVASKGVGNRTLRSSVASHRQMSFDAPGFMSDKPAPAPEFKDRDGYLRKQGGRVKSMKRRWFVLKGNTLTYSVSPNVILAYFFVFFN
jgi:hypothetical protein